MSGHYEGPAAVAADRSLLLRARHWLCAEASERSGRRVPADWEQSCGLRGVQHKERGLGVRSYNGRSVYASDQFSVPRKRVVDQPDRLPRKGPMAHNVMLANGGETEDLGRRHYDMTHPPPRMPDVAAQRGKKADFPVKPTTESDQDSVGKLGAYSVFDMIGRKRPGKAKSLESGNFWPGQGTADGTALSAHGPTNDAEGYLIDYSLVRVNPLSDEPGWRDFDRTC